MILIMIILESSWATKCKNDCGIQNDKIKIIKVMTIQESVEKLMSGGMKTEYEINNLKASCKSRDASASKNIKIVKSDYFGECCEVDGRRKENQI